MGRAKNKKYKKQDGTLLVCITKYKGKKNKKYQNHFLFKTK